MPSLAWPRKQPGRRKSQFLFEMLISGFKSTEVQNFLYEEALRGHGHVRTVVGDLMERLTAAMVCGRRHKTQSNVDYCPDVSCIDSTGVRYFESKAAGMSKQVFIYEGRILKDREFVKQGNRLDYVIWHHLADTKKASTVQELETLLYASLQCVWTVPLVEIDRICSGLTVENLNSNYGGTDRKTYGSGFRIPLSLLPIDQYHNFRGERRCHIPVPIPTLF